MTAALARVAGVVDIRCGAGGGDHLAIRFSPVSVNGAGVESLKELGRVWWRRRYQVSMQLREAAAILFAVPALVMSGCESSVEIPDVVRTPELAAEVITREPAVNELPQRRYVFGRVYAQSSAATTGVRVASTMACRRGLVSGERMQPGRYQPECLRTHRVCDLTVRREFQPCGPPFASRAWSRSALDF